MSEPLANHVKPRANAKIKFAISLFSRKRKHLTTHLKSVLRYINFCVCFYFHFVLLSTSLFSPLTETPDVPINFSVSSLSSWWVFLQWAPGFDGNRPVLVFQIKVTETFFGESSIINKTIKVQDMMYKFGPESTEVTIK